MEEDKEGFDKALQALKERDQNNFQRKSGVKLGYENYRIRLMIKKTQKYNQAAEDHKRPDQIQILTLLKT